MYVKLACTCWKIEMSCSEMHGVDNFKIFLGIWEFRQNCCREGRTFLRRVNQVLKCLHRRRVNARPKCNEECNTIPIIYLLSFLKMAAGRIALKWRPGYRPLFSTEGVWQHWRCVAALKVCGSTGGGKAASQCSGYAGRQVGKPRVHLNYLVRH